MEILKKRQCNNPDAMLRLCYTSPKPVDEPVLMEYDTCTGKGSYALRIWQKSYLFRQYLEENTPS